MPRSYEQSTIEQSTNLATAAATTTAAAAMAAAAATDGASRRRLGAGLQGVVLGTLSPHQTAVNYGVGRPARELL